MNTNNFWNKIIETLNIGSYVMEATPLADWKDIWFKSQGHLTAFVLMNLISLMFKVVYINFYLTIIEIYKTVLNVAI